MADSFVSQSRDPEKEQHGSSRVSDYTMTDPVLANLPPGGSFEFAWAAFSGE